jgi:GTPase
LRDAILEALGPLPKEPAASVRDPAQALTVCFIGRPNVGKSSLSNRLLQSDRLIVNPTPGTTRDSVELGFEFEGRDGKLYPFRLIDTAGIKAATKLASPIEYFSRLRSLDAIKSTDVVFLVLDAMEGVTHQDKAIAGEAITEKKPIVIVVNKWDLVKEAFKRQGGFAPYKSERDYREKYEHALFERLYFTPGAPVIYVSAVSGYEVDRMLNAAVKLNRMLDTKLPTAKLNKIIAFLSERMPAPSIAGKRFRVYYATQTGSRPFRIKLFCNREEKLTEQYRRYLEAGLVDEFGLNGCPIYFDLVGKEKHDPGMSFSAIRAAQEQARHQAHTPKWRATEATEKDSSHETLED